MSQYAIKLEQLSKQYRIGRSRRRKNFSETLREDLDAALIAANRTIARMTGRDDYDESRRHIWALRDIDLEIFPGESIGIIGSNGAGKTTMLKILSRITAPTRGRARLRGRVGSLLEVGTGMHPELTGRENIYLNGAILGMQRREIERKFDEIVDFSGIGKFLDTPVKAYSSGMRVRLAFSVAAHLEPEILLVDEVLAVGDIAFQKKSLAKMDHVVRGGRTVLFVSHNMAAIQALCQKAAYIEDGRLVYFGAVDQAISEYLKLGTLQQTETVNRAADPARTIHIRQAKVQDAQQAGTTRFGHDQEISFEFQIAIREPAYRMFLELHVQNDRMETIFTSFDFELDENRITAREPGLYTYRLKLPAPLLAPGEYRISLYAKRRYWKSYRVIDHIEHVCPFEVFDNGSVLSRVGVNWSGQVSFPLKWEEVEKTDL